MKSRHRRHSPEKNENALHQNIVLPLNQKSLLLQNQPSIIVISGISVEQSPFKVSFREAPCIFGISWPKGGGRGVSALARMVSAYFVRSNEHFLEW